MGLGSSSLVSPVVLEVQKVLEVQVVKVVKVMTEDLVVAIEDQVKVVAKKLLVRVVTEDLAEADNCKQPIRH